MAFDIVSTGNQLPDFLRKIGYVDSGLGSGITPKAPRIGLTTGKEFTWTENGETQILPDKSIKAIIVAAAASIQKAWYEKAYKPGQVEAPDCFSLDSKVPAPNARKPQCSNCASCPKNAFGSHSTTGRGKACGDHKQIVLVWDRQPEKLATMKVPTMSLAALKKIDTAMKDANIPTQAVVCEFKFDQRYTYPVLDIGAVGFVDEGTAKRLLVAKDSEEVRQLLREVEMDDQGEAEAQKGPVVPDTVVQFGASNHVEKTEQAEAAPVEKPKRKYTRKPKETPEDVARDLARAGGLEPEIVDEMIEEHEAAAEERQASPANANVLNLLSKWGNK